MKQLSREAFKRAESFINSSARPLEEALFAYYMREGSANWVSRELKAFQNEDGGFGHGLEPDLQLPDSSILATSVGLQILRDLRVESDHRLVQGAISYLLGSYDEQAQTWPIIPPNSDSAPHAPWWQYNPDLTQYLSNPRAEIAGYMLDYKVLVPGNFSWDLLTTVLSHLQSGNRDLEMHELLCYLRLLDTETLPKNKYEELKQKLRPIVEDKVASNAEDWQQYGLKPITVAPRPTAPFAGLLSDAIEDNLDYEIDQQNEDGSWDPPWSWKDSNPEAWPHAKRAWQGILTVNNMRTLKMYGRIEE